jgi:hypothetical protein
MTPNLCAKWEERVERAALVAFPDAFGERFASEDYKHRKLAEVSAILRAAFPELAPADDRQTSTDL